MILMIFAIFYISFYLAKDIYLSHGAPQFSQQNYHFLINIFEKLPPLQENRKTDMLDFESLFVSQM